MNKEDKSREKNLEKEMGKLRKEIQELRKELREGRTNVSHPTGPRAEILELLEERGKSMSIKEIAEEMDRAEATVSGYALDLYRGGFLDRDRQLIQVSPTRRVRQLEYYIPGKKKKKWHYVD